MLLRWRKMYLYLFCIIFVCIVEKNISFLIKNVLLLSIATLPVSKYVSYSPVFPLSSPFYFLSFALPPILLSFLLSLLSFSYHLLPNRKSEHSLLFYIYIIKFWRRTVMEKYHKEVHFTFVKCVLMVYSLKRFSAYFGRNDLCKSVLMKKLLILFVPFFSTFKFDIFFVKKISHQSVSFTTRMRLKAF